MSRCFTNEPLPLPVKDELNLYFTNKLLLVGLKRSRFLMTNEPAGGLRMSRGFTNELLALLV